MLNNNGGGEIFHILPGLNRSEVLNEYITAAHATEAGSWAQQQGFIYLSARNAEELQRHLPQFIGMESEKPVLLEVFTSIEKKRRTDKILLSSTKNKKNNVPDKWTLRMNLS